LGQQHQKKPKTIGEWYDIAPSAKVTRSELMMVLEGFGFLPAEEIGRMVQRALILERERKWYRRLWRWLKATIGVRQKLENLTPEARQRVREELDRADSLDQKQEELEDEVDRRLADEDSRKEAESGS
jgi:hypothetical protein